jgi:hypothetical protein
MLTVASAASQTTPLPTFSYAGLCCNLCSMPIEIGPNDLKQCKVDKRFYAYKCKKCGRTVWVPKRAVEE